MHFPNRNSLFLMIVSMMLLFGISSFAATVQIPEWYRMSAVLSEAPVIDENFDAVVKLEAVTGNLVDSEVRVIVPEGWLVEKAVQKVDLIKQGKTEEIRFRITAKSFLSPASIVVEAALQVPVKDLSERIKKEIPESASGMIETVESWPAVSRRYTDIAFALLAEESFYPLSGDMWLNYDDRLSPSNGFKGPVFYQNPVVTAHQAQTDLEMFEKLENYLKADPQMLEKLSQSGIDVEKKRHDQITALYVLAVTAYLEQKYDLVSGFLDRIEAQISSSDNQTFENMRIASANLRGLSFWAQGQRRLAEEALKKAFYINRKNSLQRYVLRNIGLFMLAGGDRNTAAEMFRLALNMKVSYTLLAGESELLRKN